MLAKSPTIKCRGRKWKVWVADETDVTITVRVRPLRVMNTAEFTFPFRNEFRCFDDLAAEAIRSVLRNTNIFEALSASSTTTSSLAFYQ
jgi:hypothetical protein